MYQLRHGVAFATLSAAVIRKHVLERIEKIPSCFLERRSPLATGIKTLDAYSRRPFDSYSCRYAGNDSPVFGLVNRPRRRMSVAVDASGSGHCGTHAKLTFRFRRRRRLLSVGDVTEKMIVRVRFHLNDASPNRRNEPLYGDQAVSALPTFGEVELDSSDHVGVRNLPKMIEFEVTGGEVIHGCVPIVQQASVLPCADN